MSLSIHAECTPGHEELILVAGGPEHELARGAQLLQALPALFTKTDPPGALRAPLTWGTVVQLSHAFGAGWSTGPRLGAWVAEQVMRRTAGDWGALDYDPPTGLTPYSWQVEGACTIASLGRALITDEPGCGKTITTILGLVAWAARHHADGPVVVVCPASVVDSWVSAWTAWAPHVRTVAWRGPKRKALMGEADVYVTSYDTARMDAGAGKGMQSLCELKPAALVIDECHLIKTKGTARSQAVRKLAKQVTIRAGAVVALSGTPITHHPGDLWPALYCLEPSAWPSSERWVNRYCDTVATREYGLDVLGLNAAMEPEFRTTVLGQLRRVAKADVLAELPPKVYSVRTVELPKKWRKVYDDLEEQMLAELPDGTELSVMSVLAQLTRLGQLASAPGEVKVTYGPEVDDVTGLPREHTEVTLHAPSWKVAALLEVLEERVPSGEQVVVFAPSRQLIDLAGRAATEAGYRVGYVVGGQSAGNRTKDVEAFQAGQLDVMCVTTQAGGVGITLTAARTVVFLMRPWSLVEAVQAEDRCHRIGAEGHESIDVIDIVAADTLDARIRTVLRERAGQLADLVQDPRVVTELLGGESVHTTETRKSA